MPEKPEEEIEFDVIEEGADSPYNDNRNDAQDDGRDPDA
jgi:hypothetical protein